ncbi:L-aspartate oxidase [Candidatus Magnetoovum chiemensis]|nr:L-aspartate oxidase [Candidatus Magnetoovum chiemensis]
MDFLILGGGVAGLRAAIELAKYGTIYVVTKDEPRECSTMYAQGGVAVALSDEDTIDIHLEDTLKAGDGLSNKKAVEIMVNEGPERILELISWGAEFDKMDAKLSFTLEAAHTRRRILHSHGDSTGRELERVLLEKAKSMKNIMRHPFSYVLDLLVVDNKCYGAYILYDKQEIKLVLSKATILATGGGGQIFSHTTNPAVATGDGIALAYRAGAIIQDMEFVQFHPTSLYAPSAPHFLLSEALRGEGAVLRNINKEKFAHNYHPLAELAPRDIVSRFIFSEMAKTNSKYVYLDITHLDREFVKRRFPRIYKTCLKYDIDITSEPVPVTPAAHFFMGGVATDIDARTCIKGLLAAGEAACTGVHGANRLASNSLLEGLVFGHRAGKSSINYSVNPDEIDKSVLINEPTFSTIDNFEEIRSDIRKTMWKNVGVIRNSESLTRAYNTIKSFMDILNYSYKTRYENEIKNMAQTSLLITMSALNRKCSIGAHYREDFPARCSDAENHLFLTKEDASSYPTIRLNRG